MTVDSNDSRERLPPAKIKPLDKFSMRPVRVDVDVPGFDLAKSTAIFHRKRAPHKPKPVGPATPADATPSMQPPNASPVLGGTEPPQSKSNEKNSGLDFKSMI
jgi:hypothetical protein